MSAFRRVAIFVFSRVRLASIGRDPDEGLSPQAARAIGYWFAFVTSVPLYIVSPRLGISFPASWQPWGEIATMVVLFVVVSSAVERAAITNHNEIRANVRRIRGNAAAFPSREKWITRAILVLLPLVTLTLAMHFNGSLAKAMSSFSVQ